MNGCGLYYVHGLLLIGFRTGTVIPAVFPKWVTRVRVWYWILAHHAYRVPVPQYCGYAWVNHSKVSFTIFCFYCHFNQF